MISKSRCYKIAKEYIDSNQKSKESIIYSLKSNTIRLGYSTSIKKHEKELEIFNRTDFQVKKKTKKDLAKLIYLMVLNINKWKS